MESPPLPNNRSEEDEELTLLLANPMAARRKRDNEKNVAGTNTAKSGRMAGLMRALMVRHERAAMSETVCAEDPDAYCAFLERTLTVIFQSYVDAHKLKQE
jgi:hypothetical protein